MPSTKTILIEEALGLVIGMGLLFGIYYFWGEQLAAWMRAQGWV